MIQLERYKGTQTRHTCPACGVKNCFARYQNENGEYLATDIGRCNRESKCGYHKKPKDYFTENPNLSESTENRIKTKRRASYGFVEKTARQPAAESVLIKPDYIPKDILLRTLTNYEQNAFVEFLLNLFPEDSVKVWQAIKDYFIGTSREGKAVFWQVDEKNNVRTGKMIAYDPQSGKRRKEISPNWTHAELKRARFLKQEFNLVQCFFGEHLLPKNEKLIAIVEGEKSAVIASICFPEFIWLACGSKQNLKVERLKILSDRQVILYPDADGFQVWQETARAGQLLYGLNVKVSSLIENHATDEQKANGYDLADYLIQQQNEINEFNIYADRYNLALSQVLNNEELRKELDVVIDEQKSILIVDGGLSETEAESRVCDEANLRRIVVNLAL